MAYRGAQYRGSEDTMRSDAASTASASTGATAGRRQRVMGYLKAANEIRQNYVAGWSGREGGAGDGQGGDDMPGAFPDAAVVRSGDEEMILFPSYASKHVKTPKPQAQPGTIQEVSGTGRDYRDTVGAGDAEFWKREWEKAEDDKAVVDVDVRGWIYSPHKGQMSRKHRLMVSLARQLVGLPAPSGSSGNSRPGSRQTSPTRLPRPSGDRREEELAAQQAEEIVRKGEAEAGIAQSGGFSERPSKDSDGASIYSPATTPQAQARSREGSSYFNLAPSATNSSVQDSAGLLTPVQKRSSWPAPGKMTPEELMTANNHLMARLKPFMANPLANTPISVFFYNDQISRQKTIYTNAAGQFTLRAALEFVPTHVRVLVSEGLSATEEVQVTPCRGVSLISDIDDTIKHSAIGSGAREIFRNAFIRDLGDLTIEGVKQWYGKLADMGVKVHYVSNSPWQLYPILTSYFKLAGLPRGSFHLKQYSGMLQGIFEPVAERKKATLDRIMRDFPERKFVLVGDSGEADLEVYTDVVLEHPGRVLGIFIRDVTTPKNKGFFDGGGPSYGGRGHTANSSVDSLATSKQFARPDDTIDDDAELRAAVAASLKDMEDEVARNRTKVFSDLPVDARFPTSDRAEFRPMLPPRRPTAPAAPQAAEIEDDLIDFSDDDAAPVPLTKVNSIQEEKPLSVITSHHPPLPSRSPKPSPPPPIKPAKLRSPSSEAVPPIIATAPAPKANAPPKPRKPSDRVNTAVGQTKNPSPLSIHSPLTAVTSRETPPPPPPRRSGAVVGMPKKKPLPPHHLEPAQSFSPDSTALSPNSAISSKNPHALSRFNTRSTDSLRTPLSANSATTTNTDPDTLDPDAQLRPRTSFTINRPEASVLREVNSGFAILKPGTLPPPAPPPQQQQQQQQRRPQTSKAGNGTGAPQHNRLSGSSTWGPTSTSDYDSAGSSGAVTPPVQPLSKKEELWNRRWKRARAIMEERGVVLRTWRVGADVMDLCVRIVDGAIREGEREEKAETEKIEERQRAGR